MYLSPKAKELASHEGSGWSKGETVKVYELDEYTIIQFINPPHKPQQWVKFRNVGDLNYDNSIQFEVYEISEKGRQKNIGFSIPFPMAELFIKQLQNVKPR